MRWARRARGVAAAHFLGLWGLGLSGFGTSGCGGMGLEEDANKRFQSDFNCLHTTSYETGHGEFEVSGCGSRASYQCIIGQTDVLCVREGNLDALGPPPQSPPRPAPAATPHQTAFPLHTAAATMALAASFAEECNAIPGPRGMGSAEVTFGGDGHVTDVTLGDPYANNAVGDCVKSNFRRVVVPPFTGGPKKTHKSFVVPQAASGVSSAAPCRAP